MKRAHFNVVIMILVLNFSGITAEKNNKVVSRTKPVFQTTGAPRNTLVNINNIAMWVSDNGRMERRPQDDNSGVTFPRGTATAVYAGGLVWAGLVRDSGSVNPRVGGQTYYYGTVPGRIISKGVAESPSDSTVRIYRVRRDWNTADLMRDAAEINDVALASVTSEMINQVRQQYKKDWLEWPWQKGAPYYDRNFNGIYDPNPTGVYDPTKDEPGCANADQVVWFVANDLNATATSGLYGSPPIGIEMQVTCWAYQRNNQLGNVIFQRYRLIYKGTTKTPSDAFIDSMYLAKWVDADVGNYGNDFVGCDTTLSLGYTYNAVSSDAEYNKYNLPPPAVGYDFLQGPIVPASGQTARYNFGYREGFTNLPMTTFAYFAAGGFDSDPTLGQYSGTQQWWNLIRGFRPRPIYPQEPHIDPTTNLPTLYMLSGDPLTLRGWIDGLRDSPSDRRMVLASGPFPMTLGDTQEVVISLIGGKGYDNLNSISVLKTNDNAIQSFYDNMFASPHTYLPSATAQPLFNVGQPTTINVQATVDTSNVQSVMAILKLYNAVQVTSEQLYDDGLHNDELANDHIFGNAITVNQQEEGLYLNLTVTFSDNSSNTWLHVVDDITTAGPLTITSNEIVADNINGDGTANVGENVLYVLTLQNNSVVDVENLRVTPSKESRGRIIPIPFLQFDSSYSLQYDFNNDSSYLIFDVPSQYEDTSFKIDVFIRDNKRNGWRSEIEFPVQAIPYRIFSSPQEHKQGFSDWRFDVRVVNPTLVKNHEYGIAVHDSIDENRTMGISLTDISEGKDLFVRLPLPDALGHPLPQIDGFKIFRGSNWGVKGLRNELTRWHSSYPMWFEGSSRYPSDVAVFQGGVLAGIYFDRIYNGFHSVFDADSSYVVELHFDSTKIQKAYRIRPENYYSNWKILSFNDVPFTAWDMRDITSPRQLTVAWNDLANNSKWGSVEDILIYDKSYDSTGTTQFSMPPYAITDEATSGAKADIIYGVSLRPITNHTWNEKPGILVIRPWQVLTSADRFTFNPSVVGVNEDIQPTQFQLHQNYPNPFNPVTTISFELPHRSIVSLKIYNILGQLVATIHDQKEFETGKHDIPFNGSNLATGVYLYKFEANQRKSNDKSESFISVKKMLIMK